MSFAVGLYHDSARRGGLTVSTLVEATKAEEAQAKSPEGSPVSAEDLQADSDDNNQMVSEGSPAR